MIYKAPSLNEQNQGAYLIVCCFTDMANKLSHTHYTRVYARIVSAS